MKLTAEEIISIGEVYTKNNLTLGLFKYVNIFYREHREFCIDSGLSIELIDLFEKPKKGGVNKNDLLLYCLGPFINKDIYQRFSVTLPLPVQNLIFELLWNPPFTEITGEKIAGEPLVTIEKPTYRHGDPEKILKPKYYIFIVHERKYWNYSENQPYFQLSLPKELKRVLKEYYPKPEGWVIKPVHAPEKTEFIFESEKSAFKDLPKIFAFYLQGGIKYSTKNKPLPSAINKIKKTLAIDDFYSWEGLDHLRPYLLATVLGGVNIKEINDDLTETLKNILNQTYLNKKKTIAEFILADLKGFAYVEGFIKTENIFWELLKILPVKEWVKYSTLESYINIHELIPQPYSDWDSRNRIYFEEDANQNDYHYTHKVYVGTNYRQFLSFPLLRGNLFLMASLGLIDIAYNKPDTTRFGHSYFSLYDGLKYIRLNALGAYILGLDKSYKKPEGNLASKLNFSDTSLIILAEGDLTINEILLKNYTDKVSGNRFRVTYSSFLKSCQTKKDVLNKIKSFREIVNIDLPLNWLSFLDELKDKANSFVDIKDGRVFQVPFQDKELQKLLAQDAELKNYIIKAEKFHILIKNEFFPKFKERLKIFGYLVE